MPADIQIVVVEPTGSAKSTLSSNHHDNSVVTGSTSPISSIKVTLPTLPPEGVPSLPKQPEVYQTLKTIRTHNPASVEKAVKSKISVKSLVDTNAANDLANLEAILIDISNSQETAQKSRTNQSATVNQISNQNSTIETHSLQSDSLVSNVTEKIGRQTHLENSTSSAQMLDNISAAVVPVVDKVVATETVSISKDTLPVLANVEGLPISIEKILPEVYVPPSISPTFPAASTKPISPPMTDATGALAILSEIRKLKTSSSNVQLSSQTLELAQKLSDPGFVSALQDLLNSLSKTPKQEQFTTDVTSSYFYDITTTSLPLASTEEYEPEDFITKSRPRRRRIG